MNTTFLVSRVFLVNLIKRKEKCFYSSFFRNSLESLQKREYPLCKIVAFEKNLPAKNQMDFFTHTCSRWCYSIKLELKILFWSNNHHLFPVKNCVLNLLRFVWLNRSKFHSVFLTSKHFWNSKAVINYLIFKMFLNSYFRIIQRELIKMMYLKLRQHWTMFFITSGISRISLSHQSMRLRTISSLSYY